LESRHPAETALEAGTATFLLIACSLAAAAAAAAAADNTTTMGVNLLPSLGSGRVVDANY